MSDFIKPGTFYLYYGPMNSRKSQKLINHMNFFEYTKGIAYGFFKPETDTRDDTIKSRALSIEYKPIIIPADKPELILENICDQQVIAIDEIQFFKKGIVEVIYELMKKDIQIVAAGLNLSFRGETYNEMGNLISIATHPESLFAVCQHEYCNNKARFTQRWINDEPAPYNSPLNLIEGKDEKVTYGPVCIKDHCVPGKPQHKFFK